MNTHRSTPFLSTARLAVSFLAAILFASPSAHAVDMVATFNAATDVPATASSFTISAQDAVALTLNFAPSTGTTLTVVNNTGLDFIHGTFNNLAQGQVVALSFGGTMYHFVANYFGGTGNDLVLQWAITQAVAWGYNGVNQLGDGSATVRLVPGAVTASGVLAGKTILTVAAGDYHGLALCSDGTLAAWGDNNSGQLGNNSTTSSSVPVAVSNSGVLAGRTVIAVAAGGGHSLALCSDGTLAAWGNNEGGQLGNNTLVNSSLPVAVNTTGVLAGKTVIAMAAGVMHTVALCADGTLAAWGANTSGQLGNNSTTGSLVPVAVDTSGVLAGKTVVAMAAGQDHNLALCSDHTLVVWGYNGYGQLGNNGTTQSPVPVAVNTTGVLAGKVVIAVSGGRVHSLALCSDGTLAAWGYNLFGQLGNNSTTDSLVPVAVDRSGVLAGKTVITLAGGADHSLALCSDGTLTAWGWNEYGTLGDNSTTDSHVPVVVSTASLSTGERFAVGTTGQGSAYSLGLAALPPPVVPAHLLISYNSTADVPITASSYTARGTIVCSLNFAPPTCTSLTVINNTGLDFIHGTFSNLAQGQAVDLSYQGITYHFVANYYGGTGNDLVLQWANTGAAAWGYNGYGQLGNNSKTNSLAPIPVNASGVLAGKTVIAVAGGQPSSVALCSDGTLAAWGYNGSGGLGNNSTTNSLVPVAVDTSGVLAGKRVIAIATGYEQTLALCSDGTLAAWGYNGDGELGNNSTTNSPVPVAVDTSGVLAGKTVVAMAEGISHSLVLCSDGTIATWGSNNLGQLGNNSTTDSLVPVAVDTSGVLAGKTVIAVAAGQLHSLALCSDGKLVVWGYNDYGQLGNNSTTTSLVPVAVNTSGVLAGKTVIAMAAGAEFTVAACSDGTLAAWGHNNLGQLGNNSTSDSLVPIAVSTSGVLAGKTVIGVTSGFIHSLALCSDGTLAAWGDNTYDELGDNSTAQSLVPVTVNATSLPAGARFLAARSGAGAIHSLALVATPGSQVAPPQIAVEQPAGTGLTSGASTVDFGINSVGTASPKTFTIRNTGTATLAISSTTIDGANAADYTVTTSAATSVAGGASTTLTVTFTASAGNRNAVLHIASNDPNTALFSVNLTGTTIVPRVTLAATFNTATDLPVTASSYTATGSAVNFTLNFAPPTGTNLTVVNNTGTNFIHGTFGNLAQGQAVALSFGGTTYNFVANYYGGTGNDLVLQWANVQLMGWGHNYSGQLGNHSTTQSGVPVAVDTTGLFSGRTVVATGSADPFSLGLCADGTLASWGANWNGQLGNGTTTDSNVPTAVTTSGVLAGKTVIAVSAGYLHGLALCSDGTVAAWGSNSNGQLGNNSTTDSYVPVAVTRSGVLAGRTVIAIAAGNQHSLALCSDGTLAAWGYNIYGALGNGTTTDSAVPVAVTRTGVLAGKTIISLGAGFHYSLALCSDGTLATWGYNGYFALGTGNSNNSLVPVTVDSSGVLAGRKIIAAAAGGLHCLVLCADGTLATWGTNQYGELGNNTTTTSFTPVAVDMSGALSGRTVTQVAAGEMHSLALCSDGTVAAWGNNTYAQLGNNSTVNSPVPVMVDTSSLPPGSRFVSVNAGQNSIHSFALLATPGSLAAPPQIAVEQPAGTSLTSGASTVDFGSNDVGTASPKTFTIRNTGVADLAISSTTIDGTNAADYTVTTSAATSVAAGASTTLTVTFTAGAVGSRNAVLHIASNDPNAALFNVNLTGTGTSTLAATFNSATDVPVTAGSYTATGNTVNFTLNFAPPAGTTLTVVNNTGLNFIHGTFGNLAQGQAVALNFGGTMYHFVANYYGGTGNDLVLQWANTEAVAWGYNGASQLGDGSATDRWVPGAVTASGVLAGKTIIAVAAGDYHGLALCSDGTLAAWGDNNSGQLGDGSTTRSSVPVAVSTSGILAGRTVIAVAAGGSHSLALCSDGTLAAWGNNEGGQLSDNTHVNSSLPMAVNTAGVLAGKTVISMAAGIVHTVVLCADGTLAAWGANGSGQLGNNSTTGSPVPVAVDRSGVLAGKTVISMAAGQNHNLALCSDHTLVAWGYNGYGQLGNNSTTQSPVPVAVNTSGVLSGKTVIAVSGGREHSLALCSDGTVAAWGYNLFGQLGNNSTADSWVPVAVSAAGVLAGKTVITLAGGADHSLALCSDGTLTAWGWNEYGTLGDNSTTDSHVPVAVSTASLAAGERFVVGTTGQGSAYSLGLIALPAPRNDYPGQYAGFVQPQTGTSGGVSSEGFFTAAVQTSGAFTGRLYLNGQVLSIAGMFDTGGVARFGRNHASTFASEQRPKPPLTIELRRDFTHPITGITGTVTQFTRSVVTTVSTIHADYAFFDGKSAATTAPASYLGNAHADGQFTMILPAIAPDGFNHIATGQTPGFGLADYPQSTGFGVLRITRTGVVGYAGKMADGASISGSTALVRHASAAAITFPLFAPIYQGEGFVSANVVLDSTNPQSDFSVDGSHVRWARPASTSQYYPNGWPEVIITNLQGSKYTITPGQSVLPGLLPPGPGGNALLQITNLLSVGATPYGGLLNISKTDGATKVYPADKSFTFSLNRATGQFAGTFAPGDGSRPPYQGVIYQKGTQSGGSGFYLTTPPRVKDYKGQSGPLTLSVWPSPN